ncbi:hypothetical protein VNO78_12761 [Psophocarpus tetragonolobus]|uniref:Uncharacterized protein n=1 Tax=Psophocarpus tetragonolobus TaxID=3891 RepID=A0AAN9XPN0_PSOTE
MANSYLSLHVLILVTVLLTLGFAESDSYKHPFNPQVYSPKPRAYLPPPPIPNVSFKPPVYKPPYKKPPSGKNPPSEDNGHF